MISNNKMQTGALFGGRRVDVFPRAIESGTEAGAPHSIAFVGLFVFTLLLYARPQELLPQVFGDLPLGKIIAIGTLVAYAIGKLRAGERFTICPLEMLMLATIVALGVMLVPIAREPQHSIDLLTDTFFKVITIFILIVNLITTRQRLHSIMRLVVLCGVLLALVTIGRFLTGNFDVSHVSKELQPSVSGNTFDNTNELALTLDLLLPFAVIFAVTRRGVVRFAYGVAAAVIAMGAIITFSRGGFLGLISLGGVLLWKLGRGRRGTMALAAIVMTGLFAFIVPSGYRERVFTIFSPADDPTNSAQERQEILGRGLEVALHHPIAGVGMANFVEYSIKGKVAHNSYIEIAAELGWAGLLAYLVFLLAPFRSLNLIERELLECDRKKNRDQAENRELYFLSVALQAVMTAFLVCSLFSSSQYFWHPYYIVGYSIALRRIHAAQAAKETMTSHDADEESATGALFRNRPGERTGVLV